MAARENAADNHVADRLQICDRPDQIPTGCDVLLANILADLLISSRHQLTCALRPGGRWVLSGILTAQESEVASAFKQWCDMARFAQRDGWVTLSGVQR